MFPVLVTFEYKYSPTGPDPTSTRKHMLRTRPSHIGLLPGERTDSAAVCALLHLPHHHVVPRAASPVRMRPSGPAVPGASPRHAFTSRTKCTKFGSQPYKVFVIGIYRVISREIGLLNTDTPQGIRSAKKRHSFVSCCCSPLSLESLSRNRTTAICRPEAMQGKDK